MLSSTALAATSRSVLPPFALSETLALLERASARLRSSSAMSGFRCLRLCFGRSRFDRLGCNGLGAVGGLLGQADRAQVFRSLADRDVSRGDLRHRLNAFGLLRRLSVLPDLFQLGRSLGFGFAIHHGLM